MQKEEILEKIKELGLLAVIRGGSAEEAVKIVDALVDGGVTGIEITFTTPDALDVVCTLAKKYGDNILLGMGTLTKPENAEAAKQAGGQFLVSPHTEERLADAMKRTGLPIMMGALTPSEVYQSFRLGSDVVKLFPGSFGGVAYMKALKGPFPDIPIIPTGGVN
ncbi:MAG: bifunctional 4-hydroxy-2-oxoglutarate aldolase/2-dehydro-3-deoxy-phosphogluconate aldolase, partial [Anaerolineales bacterium]